VDSHRATAVAYISVGSNLGDRGAHLAAALDGLRETAGIDPIRVSPVFETQPIGPPPQGPYWNAVVAVRSRLTPRELLDRLFAIERDRGRTRGAVRNSARTLDLDLLLFGDLVIDEPGLTLPHPRLHERAFVLEPLTAIAGHVLHPLSGERIDALAARVRDPRAVRPAPPDARVESRRPLVNNPDS